MDALSLPLDLIHQEINNSAAATALSKLEFTFQDDLTGRNLKKTGLFEIIRYSREWLESLDRHSANLSHIQITNKGLTNFLEAISKYFSTIHERNFSIDQLYYLWEDRFGEPNKWTIINSSYSFNPLTRVDTEQFAFISSVISDYPPDNADGIYAGAKHIYSESRLSKAEMFSPGNILGMHVAIDHSRKTYKSKPYKDSIKNFFDRVIKSLESRVDQIDQSFTGRTSDITQLLDSLSSNVNNLVDEKGKIINNWQAEKSDEFDNWFKETDERHKGLETAWNAKLALSKPAEYWENRKKLMNKHGKDALNLTIGFISVIVVILWFILTVTPDTLFMSLFAENPAKGIRWSIVFIAFLTFSGIGVRMLTKYMFSCFHLARDAEERLTLTHYYQSMAAEGLIATEERTMVIQSLFSRSDTGLLKEDSGPTMPMDIVNLIGSSNKS